ncbi:ABC transporter substrate-binding protein [Gracilinema caldarium]|uniref:ABC-type transporter, periplasmic subunit n=1 Tax=Gracilinema caldarium (strain ATCC 51460 / DSM 7334 / H1) TaxID=744872 RepID=F8F0K8_GRAC1|nr:cobalamin-binding protein [Gracilinema caldarium]AEJ19352.1 ABC-type transporter, periplasmic subunit [Gracilinema caldarium DSM 7334]
MKKNLASLLVVVMAAAISLPLFAQPRFTDAAGRSITLQQSAGRIVSLTPAVTETLFAIGAGDQVVGVTEFCNYPSAVSSKTRVGGFSGATISIEQIVALKPDLVILSAVMHAKVIPLLDQVKIPCFAVEPGSFADVYRDILTLGALTGHEKEARTVVTAMQKRIAAVQTIPTTKGTPRVFWELWDDPLMTAGGPTFISEAIVLAGGKNVFADLQEQWPQVSFEELLVRNPDWILSGTDHGDRMRLEDIMNRPGWLNIPAVKNGKIATIESDIIYRGGPRLADAVEALAKILK